MFTSLQFIYFFEGLACITFVQNIVFSEICLQLPFTFQLKIELTYGIIKVKVKVLVQSLL